MDASTRATGYDVFKLIVALILLILFFLLLWRPASQPLTAASTTVPLTPSVTLDANPIAILATPTSLSLTLTSIPSPSPTQAMESTPTPSPSGTAAIDSTSISPSSPTQTIEPTPTALVASTATDPNTPTMTPLPSPTSTATTQSTSTPVGETPSTTTACDAAAARSRLQTGMNATILLRLNFRSLPGIRDNWLRTNIRGTKVEVIGGPECLPHVSGAYVWWQIRLPDGRIGWSAEGSIHGTFYFMEPIQ